MAYSHILQNTESIPSTSHSLSSEQRQRKRKTNDEPLFDILKDIADYESAGVRQGRHRELKDKKTSFKTFFYFEYERNSCKLSGVVAVVERLTIISKAEDK